MAFWIGFQIMYLFRKRIRGKSIQHPLGKLKDIEPLTDERKLELTTSLKSGNLEVMGELIKGHIKLAINIASQYASKFSTIDEDLVSVAMLGLTDACHRVANGKLVDDNITAYFISRVHTVCSEAVNLTSLLHTPRSTIKYRKKEGIELSAPKITELNPKRNIKQRLKEHHSYCDNPSFAQGTFKITIGDLREMLDDSICTVAERTVIELVLQRYTVREISAKLGIDKVKICKLIYAVRERFDERIQKC